jgi:diguanylate cyclase (GGDEF)-like protein
MTPRTITGGSPPSALTRLRSLLPHGGSLPSGEWQRRHRVIVLLLWLTVFAVPAYALLLRGVGALRYLPEQLSMLTFALVAGRRVVSGKLRSVAASMGLLTAAASLVDVSGGLIEMHFAFFVVIVILTMYEDWLPFLLAVGFVLLHHGIMGTLDPHAVFNRPAEWADPWAWAALHALFVAMAGVAGVTAWRLNEQVRERMREAQAELARIGETDSLTGLSNRRRLMSDLAAVYEKGGNTALTLFDLDGFKDYNDRFGHPAGDSLLSRLAGRLRENVGDAGTTYRLGGDEFCVLAKAATGEGLERLERRWTATFVERGEGFAISASRGSVLIPGEAADPSEALRVCDHRMYVAKNGGRPTAASQTKNVLLAALSARHSDLGPHGNGVALVADGVAEALRLSHEERQDLRYAAELHDIGKVAIPDSILHKPGPLDADEWDFIRRHTLIGERILAAAPALTRVAQIVRSTHERFDGQGYPDNLVGESIPLAARIIAACDAYDAMTSARPYQQAVSHRDALAELQRCAGTQFDPNVIDTLLRVASALHEAPHLTVNADDTAAA